MTQVRRHRFDIRRAGKALLVAYLAVLAVNAAFYVLATRPHRLEFDELSTESGPRFRELERRQAEVEDKEAFRTALDRAAEDLVHWKTDLLSTRQRRMVAVQLELAKLARQFQINLKSVNYQNDVLQDEALERFGMVVPLHGGYQALRKFIQAVEQSEEFLVIERVALATGKEGGVLLELNITLAAYFDAPELRKAREGRPVPSRRRT